MTTKTVNAQPDYTGIGLSNVKMDFIRFSYVASMRNAYESQRNDSFE